jgi:hypothetical protein
MEGVMITMPQITAALITGLFVLAALLIQRTLLSRKKKIEDIAGAIIQRRAELYRELLVSICSTGVQFEYEIGGMPVTEKIVFLHETCNRALYEFSPFAGINAINAVTKLSAVCAKHRLPVTEAPGEELNKKWLDFKHEFQFHFLTLVTLARNDCMGEAIDRFIEDAKIKRYVRMLGGYPRNTGGKNRRVKI